LDVSPTPANWHLTTAFEAGVHRPFGAHAYRGFRMVEGRQQRLGPCIVKTAFDSHRALADGRQGLLRRQRLANTRFQFQALQPGGGKDNGVILTVIQFTQPSTDVTAQRADHQVWTGGGQLALTA